MGVQPVLPGRGAAGAGGAARVWGRSLLGGHLAQQRRHLLALGLAALVGAELQKCQGAAGDAGG